MQAAARDGLSSSGARLQRDAGYAMIALLGVLLILAVLAAIAMSSLSGRTPGRGTAGLGGLSVTTAPPAGAPDAAQAAACEADYQTVTAAIEDYRALNGALPPAGTAWTAGSSTGGPYLGSWPSDPRFTLQWDGAQLNVLPATGQPSHGSAGSSSPPTGCLAL